MSTLPMVNGVTHKELVKTLFFEAGKDNWVGPNTLPRESSACKDSVLLLVCVKWPVSIHKLCSFKSQVSVVHTVTQLAPQGL